MLKFDSKFYKYIFIGVTVGCYFFTSDILGFIDPQMYNQFSGAGQVAVQIDVFMINALHVGIAEFKGNVLYLHGDHGAFSMQIFWPTLKLDLAIVFGIIIGFFVLKTNVSKHHGIAYVIIGIIGTIGIALITLLINSLFVLRVSTDITSFQVFHAQMGFLSLAWMIIYILVIDKIETRYSSRKNI